jgi:hypothetical protein
MTPPARRSRIWPVPQARRHRDGLLWAVAADAPWVIMEANLRLHDPHQRAKLAAVAEDPVYRQCDPGLLRAATTTGPTRPRDHHQSRQDAGRSTSDEHRAANVSE